MLFPARLLCAWLLFGAVLAPRYASACDVGDADRFTIEANEADQTPPSAPAVRVVEIDRSHRPGCNAGACDFSSLRLEVSATDDVSAGSEIGYEVHSDRVGLASELYAADKNGELFFVIDASDDGGPIDFDVEVFAVDQAGNVSAHSTTVRVRDRDGCAVGSASGAGALWSFVMMAVLLYRNRRLARRNPTLASASPR